MSKRREISVVVTGVGGGSIGEQIIFALRAAKTPYRIIATDADSFSLGLYSANEGYLVPIATDKTYLSRMLEICKKESAKVLIPGSEAELVKISKNKDLFEEQEILLLMNSSKVIDLCSNKWKTYLFLKNNGFNVPESYLCEEDINNINFEYPVIIKPCVGTGGSRFVFVAQNDDELSFFVRYLKRQGYTPIVQKYVGTAEDEYTAGVLTSLEGKLLGSIVIRRRLVSGLSTLYKIKNYKVDSEPLLISSGISQGVTDGFPEVRKYAEQIALKLGSKGPINIQCRMTKNGISVFEINPRFSGTESLRALAGYNAPDTLIRKHLLNEGTKQMHCERGIVLRGLVNYFKRFPTSDSVLEDTEERKCQQIIKNF